MTDPNPDRERRLAGPLPYQPAAHRPDPHAADLKPFKPYVYRGQGHDILEADPFEEEFASIPPPSFCSEIPLACSCTWAWGPPGFRWERIGAREGCPWHRAGDALMERMRQP